MKASVIFIVLIIFNTTALIAEPIAQLIKELNTWILVAAEGVLVLGYYINTIISDLREVAKIDLSGINLFTIKPNQ